MTNIVFRPRCADPSNKINKVAENVNNTPLDELIQEKRTRQSPVYANIQEMNDRFIITLAVPGYDKSEIKINLDNNQLKVTGNRNMDSVQKFNRREFDYSSFERIFYLPEDIQKDKIEAKAENGLLMIVILKSEVKPALQVTIK